MSNYHILDMPKSDRLRVAFHVSIPDVANNVSVSYRTALVQYLGDKDVSQVPNLATSHETEYASLQAGAVYEHIEVVEFDAGLTVTQKRAAVEARYTELVATIRADLQQKLSFWGFSADVS